MVAKKREIECIDYDNLLYSNNVVLETHRSDLIMHSKTSKHTRKANCLVVAKQPKLNSFGNIFFYLPFYYIIQFIYLCICYFYIRFIHSIQAVYIPTHTSINSIEHLGELLKMFGKGSLLESLHLHSAKCIQLLILNVISPAIVEQLVTETQTLVILDIL